MAAQGLARYDLGHSPNKTDLGRPILNLFLGPILLPVAMLKRKSGDQQRFAIVGADFLPGEGLHRDPTIDREVRLLAEHSLDVGPRVESQAGGCGRKQALCPLAASMRQAPDKLCVTESLPHVSHERRRLVVSRH